MKEALLRTDKEQDFTEIYYKHVDAVFRLCFTYLKNKQDTDDAVQEVFLKLLKYKGKFESEEHRKAWLIVTASNYCKNFLKHWWRKRKNIDDYTEIIGGASYEVDEMMELVLALPDKYKTAVYLYYYEGYDSAQIAKMINKPAGTIRSHLSTARKMLKKEME
ncbi:MAG: RNA polymerase sigma factor [Eubacterium sp.]|nr:RNA polymerase sigma factor [Eubacterium sp.]